MYIIHNLKKNYTVHPYRLGDEEEIVEPEIDKAIKNDQKKPNIFRILKNEIDALERKEERMKVKLKPNKND